MTGKRAGMALLVLLCLLGSVPSFAQDAYQVVDIETVGNHIATRSMIMGVVSIDLGSPLTATAVQKSIQRLYSLGFITDVTIEVEDVTGGVKVYIVVQEAPKLDSLVFTGNDEIDSDDLEDKLGLAVGGWISPYFVHTKSREILDIYAEKGYFRTTIESSLTYSKDSTSAVLTFHVKERSKVKVEKVILTGNVRIEADDLIGEMRNRKRGFLRTSDFAQDKYDEDLEKVIAKFHKEGYIDAHMISDSIAIDSTTNRMRIYLEVYEGPKYYFGQVTFKNNFEIEEKYLRRALKFDEFDVFDAEKYQESTYELYSTYQEIGHLHAGIYDDKVTRSDSLIDITYDITEGLPSHINLVHIVGNTKTRDYVVRREISSLPGKIFNRALLIRSVRDVMALNYFTNVVPEPVNLPNGDVDLEFTVEEKQTAQISAGAGYNSQDKVVGSVGMGIPNFRGVGQSLSFNVDFGSRRNSVSISFTEPWLFGRPTLLGTDLFAVNRRWFSDYTEERQGGSIRLGRRLRWPDNYFRVFVSYRLERNRFHDFADGFINANSFKNKYIHDLNGDNVWQPPTFDPETGNYQAGDSLLDVTDVAGGDKIAYGLPYPGSVASFGSEWNAASKMSLTISRDSRNLPEFATKGSQLSYTFSATGGILGGYWNYLKHEIKLAKFVPLFWGFALAAKVQYGVITGSDDRILITDRFNPGGTAYDGIVRGYSDGILTPDTVIRDSDTSYFYSAVPNSDSLGYNSDYFNTAAERRVRVRGKYMLVTNIEMQVPIVQNQLYALAFFDAGNSWLSFPSFKDDHIYKSYGFGFRLMIPGMGTLGFDFGKPLDQFRDESTGWRPHFQIGTTFR